MKNSTALYDKLFRIAMVTVMASSAVSVVAQTIMIESKEPSITKIALQAENTNGFIMSENKVELTFNKPFASFDEIIING